MLDSKKQQAGDEGELLKLRRSELGRFLRDRRSRLQPNDVGVTLPGRRHVRGLRREEVAAIARIGVSWYTMLEQGRVENVSPHILSAVARALRLSGAERSHLSALASGSFEELNINAAPPPPELLSFVRHATVGMAFIVSARFDVLAYNDKADDFFRFSAHGPAPNLVRIMLEDPAMMQRFIAPSWQAVLEQMVGHLRLMWGRVGGSAFERLVEELRAYPMFKIIWDQPVVTYPPSERSVLRTPDLGTFTVHVSAFTCFSCPTYTIIFKTTVDPGQLRTNAAAPAKATHSFVANADDERRRRADLGAFLRQRRERLRPQDIDLVSVGRRHAKGLRRNEVADRARIGVSWYTMLEQGRIESVTRRTLRAVADALALNHRERLYLEHLSAQSFSELGGVEGPVHDDILGMINSFPDAHAHFHDVHFNMLAWNSDAEEFYSYGKFAKANMLQVMVRNKALRTQFVAPDWFASISRMLAHYRFTHALTEDSDPNGLVAGLTRESPEFDIAWRTDLTVLNPAIEAGVLQYPRSGRRHVHVLVLSPTRWPTHTLIIKVRSTDR